jgi:hypothetical protein
MPVSCDGLHVALGLATAATGPRGVRVLLLILFVLYQAVEEIPDGEVASFVRDCAAYTLGLGVGLVVRWVRQERQSERPVH